MPPETRAAETLTIAWTVSVTGVFIADLMWLAAFLVEHWFAFIGLLTNMMLLAAAAMGSVSLVLLPLVWRARRVKPPHGYIAFALLVGLTPLAATVVRLLS
jgi:hypothetical protein